MDGQEGPDARQTALNLKKKFHKLIKKNIDKDASELIDHLLVCINMGDQMTASDYEIQAYLLVRCGNTDIEKLTSALDHIIDQRPYRLGLVLDDCINQLINQNKVEQALSLSCKAILKQTRGSLELLSPRWTSESKALSSFIYKVDANELMSLVRSQIDAHSLHGSMLATTFISVASQHSEKLELSRYLFELKLSLGLAKAVDLREVMVGLSLAGHYQQALDIHFEHPELHESWLYDVVLHCAGKTKNWDELQRQFEALFQYDSLPNLNHYRIVMRALSVMGPANIVDSLFEQLVVERHLKPSRAIFHALMCCYSAVGDGPGVMRVFDHMVGEPFNIPATTNTYLLVLLSMRDQRTNASALQIVGRMAREHVPIDNHILSALLANCITRRDAATATALMKWAKSYNLQPDIVVFNALISCYMESNKISAGLRVYESLKRLCPSSPAFTPRVDTVTAVLQGLARFRDQEGSLEAKVNSIVNDMNTFNLKPDARYYTALLMYYTNNKQMENAEKVFNEDMAFHNVRPSAYHYTLMMGAYIVQKNYKGCNDLYEAMRRERITPTFTTQKNFLIMTTKHKNERTQAKALKIYSSFAKQSKDNPVLDLESKVTPKTRLPIAVAEPVINQLMRKKDYGGAMDILKPFMESSLEPHDALEQLKVSALALKLYLRSSQWQLIEGEWAKFVLALKTLFVFQPHSPGNKRQRTALNQLEAKSTVTLDKFALSKDEFQNATKGDIHGHLRLPSRYSHDYEDALNARIFQLGHESRCSELENLLSWAYKVGLQPTSNNVNTVVQMMFKDDKHLIDGLRLAEKRLAQGYVNRAFASMSWKEGSDITDHRRHGMQVKAGSGRFPAHLVSNRTLSKSTLNEIRFRYDDIVSQVMLQNNLMRTQAPMWLNDNMPNVMAAMSLKFRDKGSPL